MLSQTSIDEVERQRIVYLNPQISAKKEHYRTRKEISVVFKYGSAETFEGVVAIKV